MNAAAVYTIKFKSVADIETGCKVQIVIPSDHRIDPSAPIKVEGQIGSGAMITFSQANGKLSLVAATLTIDGMFINKYTKDG